MVKAAIAAAVVFAVLVGWIGVQQLYARFAARYPELGPFRVPDGACGGGCACKGGSCSRD